LTSLDTERAISLVDETIDEVMKYYVGNKATISKIVAAIISGGHVLMEDYPGLGKTFVAKLLANVLGISYKRIQFTPDLLPSDIVGTKVWRPVKAEFELMRGPIFANLVLADEINRAPPKTQAALLEAMEEGQVTIEGETVPLPQPFIVLATQNPIEFEGTYPLPEAQLDRFMIRMSLGYPEQEIDLLRRRVSWREDDPTDRAEKVMTADLLSQTRALVESSVNISEEILQYIVQFAQCRKDQRVLAGPSPRGLLSLLRLSRAIAMLEQRDFVIPDDVKSIVKETLAHRLVLKQEFTLEQIDPGAILDEYVAKIPVPK
jgi:MoxR-like ATPase